MKSFLCCPCCEWRRGHQFSIPLGQVKEFFLCWVKWDKFSFFREMAANGTSNEEGVRYICLLPCCCFPSSWCNFSFLCKSNCNICSFSISNRSIKSIFASGEPEQEINNNPTQNSLMSKESALRILSMHAQNLSLLLFCPMHAASMFHKKSAGIHKQAVFSKSFFSCTSRFQISDQDLFAKIYLQMQHFFLSKKEIPFSHTLPSLQ